MKKKRTINCPKCKDRIGFYDGKGSMDILCACRKCRIAVLYEVESKSTFIRKYPERNTISGMRFY